MVYKLTFGIQTLNGKNNTKSQKGKSTTTLSLVLLLCMGLGLLLQQMLDHLQKSNKINKSTAVSPYNFARKEPRYEKDNGTADSKLTTQE